MTRGFWVLLVSFVQGACASPGAPAANTPCPAAVSAPAATGALTSGSPGLAAASVQSPAIDKLETPVCEQRQFGCASCATEGVWGSLRVANDCSRHCEKICGNSPVTAPPAMALAPQVFGPNLLDMNVNLPSELVMPHKSEPTKKKTAAAAGELTFAERKSSFSIAASRDSINCGLLGPVNAAITCNPPDIAHCACETAGIWGKANCECRPPSPSAARWSSVNNCHIDAQPHSSCPAAGLPDVADPGCTTNCPVGLASLCKAATCVGSTWAQSICGCVPH